MSVSYERLRTEQVGPVCDHTAIWDRLRPVESAPDRERRQIEQFCDSKRISYDALVALRARFITRDVGLCLAYAGTNGNGRVTAIKYRPINGTSHASFAEKPSRWLRPIVLGNPASLEWLMPEGETDAARLYDLVGNRCAIMVLPVGARGFDPAWADVIPRGATVGLCHDADAEGDKGAEHAAKVIGGRTVRVRPPVEGGDWCDWDGDQAAFITLAQPQREEMHIVTLEEFVAVEEPGSAPLLGEGEGATLIAEGSDAMFYGDGGAGKTTLAVDLAFHLAAGEPWLGIAVPRPVNVLLIENEGPRPMFRRKLARKFAAWTGKPPGVRIRVHERPWRKFTFADEQWRADLARVVAEHEIDIVIAGPLTRIGMDSAGTLQEVVAFTELIEDVRRLLDRPLAVLLVHHENKSGTVSGAWEGSGDTLVHIEAAGNGHTIVFFRKARWDDDRQGTTMKLAWAEGQGYVLEGDRDLLAEVEAWFDEHGWHIVKEICDKKADPPGIGANQDAVRRVLEGNPERFATRTGEAAKALGRSSTAVLWNRLGSPESPESPRLFGDSLGGGRKGGDSVTPP